ncbi:hypothetical protein HPP92_005394 [Vanilla planifolia]|uniref:Uncharacterized protein n=1 Tax=Vanilla planifolia TaxID=51239 RepID=A0A835VD52_VANPL|nr:hypothetical protein HPP92_005394 [Vanilla planifolia]
MAWIRKSHVATTSGCLATAPPCSRSILSILRAAAVLDWGLFMMDYDDEILETSNVESIEDDYTTDETEMCNDDDEHYELVDIAFSSDEPTLKLLLTSCYVTIFKEKRCLDAMEMKQLSKSKDKIILESRLATGLRISVRIYKYSRATEHKKPAATSDKKESHLKRGASFGEDTCIALIPYACQEAAANATEDKEFNGFND